MTPKIIVSPSFVDPSYTDLYISYVENNIFHTIQYIVRTDSFKKQFRLEKLINLLQEMNITITDMRNTGFDVIPAQPKLTRTSALISKFIDLKDKKSVKTLIGEIKTIYRLD